ncbi:ABC transporter substrate-binding protein, partial [Staphylococcus caprae]
HTYHRIISLIPSNTEILYRLGLGKNIIGVSTVDDYPKNVKKGKQQFDAMNLNKEALLKAKSDLILAHESQKSSAKKTLDSLA